MQQEFFIRNSEQTMREDILQDEELFEVED